ncbi:MAG: DNA topoisomerase VI subunit B [Candidatus Eisenbacteria sp.]|nr:DNA topoisomerase VI subunit B [Candidatus Eisenbacteria bacterium]
MTREPASGAEAQLEVPFSGRVEAGTRKAKRGGAKTGRRSEPGNDRPAARKRRRRKGPAKRGQHADVAESMASKQREISVSEFFAKNRHLLGFDNPAKALLTTVKEAVDNALDACEEAGILPEVLVRVEQLAEDRFRMIVEDNGPGIVHAQVPKIFGKLLYGSKFHTLKQSRGQQGIGISAAGMYGLLTTGKPVEIISRAGPRRAANHFHVVINTKKNLPQTLVDAEVEWEKPHGTQVAITLQGTYKKGRHSIDGYLKQVVVANPHATIIYEPPNGDKAGERIVYERTTDQAPREPREIRPHPHGVELGVFLKMLQGTSARTVRSFLQEEFSRVGNKVVQNLLQETESAGLRLTPRTPPRRISAEDAEVLHSALGRIKIMAPSTDCLSPIGEDLLVKALEKRVTADFYTAATRPPAVYRGNPFQIEVGLAYGGGMPGDTLIELYRYANRVPLQYQRGACAMTKATVELPWRNYKISQSRGALPAAPMVLAINIASVWVPFTSESKEAVAHYPEILHEIRLALQECGRRLAVHISRRRREADEEKKHSYIQKYIPHIGIALQEILGLSDRQRERTVDTLTDVLERSRKM